MSNENCLKKFGKNLKTIREKQGLTIKELAQKTGIREEYLKKIEQGNAMGIKISHIWKLSHALDIKLNVLCNEK